jgi:hypothetical protein
MAEDPATEPSKEQREQAPSDYSWQDASSCLLLLPTGMAQLPPLVPSDPVSLHQGSCDQAPFSQTPEEL